MPAPCHVPPNDQAAPADAGDPVDPRRSELETRVLVVADQALVADAVRTALVSQGLDAIGASVSRGTLTHMHTQTARLMQLGPGVLLVLADLTRESRLEAARVLIDDLRLPTVVLATTEDEALWGAVLESGATAVMSASASLNQVARALRQVARGAILIQPGRRRAMIEAWRRTVRARYEVAARIGSLSPRELEVLRLLYRGETVQEIAVHFGVAVGTVRSQVRSILRKLGVSSQLAAVAVYVQLGPLADNGG